MKSSETSGDSSEKTKKFGNRFGNNYKKFGNKFGNTSKKFGNKFGENQESSGSAGLSSEKTIYSSENN